MTAFFIAKKEFRNAVTIFYLPALLSNEQNKER